MFLYAMQYERNLRIGEFIMIAFYWIGIAHFKLDNYANDKNCRIWDLSNPGVGAEEPLYPQRVTVCCGL